MQSSTRPNHRIKKIGFKGVDWEYAMNALLRIHPPHDDAKNREK